MAENIGGDDRVLRVCDLCGGVDDHPRHVIAGNVTGVFPPSDGALERVMEEAPPERRGQLVRDLLDTTSSDRHKQCCADAGCPTGECPIWVEGSDGKVGAAFLDHLKATREERMPLIEQLNSIERGE